MHALLCSTLREAIDSQLSRRTELSGGCPDRLREAMRYSLLAPGKRLRPVLALLACGLCAGGDTAAEPFTAERLLAACLPAMPAACAVEMIHCYSLIHDDLPAMDNDDLRRGQPTCHRRFDEATAILAADALLTLAFETIAEIPSSAVSARCAALLAKAAGARGMVGGQADDVAFAAADPTLRRSMRTRALLEAIHRRKTGAMITVSVQLGAVSAGAGPAAVDALCRYGRAMGMAFQITDDLLDLEGDETTVGKRLHKDTEAGKLTFPSVLGADASREEARKQIDTARDALTFFPEHPCRTALDTTVSSLWNRVK